MKRKYVLGACGTAVGLALWLLASPQNEPEARGKPLQHWVAELQQADADRSRLAASVLREMGPTAVPALLRRLDRGPQNTTQFTRWINRNVPRDWRPLTVSLLTGISRRMETLHALGAIGPDAAQAIPVLARIYEVEDMPIRGAAGSALLGIGKSSVPVLARALRKGDFRQRADAAKLLHAMGPNAAAALPALVQAASTGTGSSMPLARLAMRRIGPPAAAYLLPQLESVNPTNRFHAIMLLAYLGQHATIALPALGKIAAQPADPFNSQAINAVREINKVRNEPEVLK